MNLNKLLSTRGELEKFTELMMSKGIESNTVIWKAVRKKSVKALLSKIWRHGSASILGTTRTDTRAPMLMHWAGLSRIVSSQERRSK